jgi:hypothetical protein
MNSYLKNTDTAYHFMIKLPCVKFNEDTYKVLIDRLFTICSITWSFT